MTESQIDIVIQAMPWPCFIVNQDQAVVFVNQAAHRVFDSADAVIAACLASDTFDPRQSGSCKIDYEGQSLEMTWVQDNGQFIVFLAAHIDSPDKAQKKRQQNLLNLVTTTRGYAELIAVMLEEESTVDGERLAAVRRYEQSVNDHLSDMEALLTDPSRVSVDYKLDEDLRPKAIVFFENAVRGELIAELFSAQGMDVCLARSAADALKQVENNTREIQLGVFEQPGPAAEQLLKCHPRSILIYCNTSLKFDKSNPRIGQVADQPMDINDLLRTSVEMLSR